MDGKPQFENSDSTKWPCPCSFSVACNPWINVMGTIVPQNSHHEVLVAPVQISSSSTGDLKHWQVLTVHLDAHWEKSTAKQLHSADDDTT